jgi:DNA-binding SARP family transcriptional activator
MGGVQDMRIRLLGDLRVEGADVAALGSRKSRTLIKVLALGRGRPVSADALVDALWPEGDEAPADPVHQVSVLVSRLRRVVGTERVTRSDAGYALAVDWLDLDALGGLVAEAEGRLRAGAVPAARAAASAALAVVRGPFLADEPEAEWAAADRTAAERLVARARQVAAEAALAAGDMLASAELAERALERDPYDEVALRTLMQALAGSGRPASALAAFAAVRERLGEDLGTDPAPETEALHTAILRGERPVGTPPPPGAAAGLTGRGEELAALDAALGRVAGGHGELVVVEGEPGIGKTRLLRTWAGRAEAQGARVVFVTCDELGRTLPLQPVIEVVDVLTGGGRDEVAGSALSLLRPLLGRSASLEAATLAALTDPGAGQALLLGAIRNAVREAAATSPLVVILDDTHVADAATLAWLSRADRDFSEAMVLIVAAQRADEGRRLPARLTVRLGPLDLAEVREIVGSDRAGSIYERSGGLPLFVAELAATGDDQEVPASILATIARRCDAMGPAAAALRAAAVIGPEVDLDLLVSVTGLAPGELLDHLEEAVRRGLLEDQGGVFAFRNALIRDALDAAATPARRALIHSEAARALRSRTEVPPLLLAHHARLGGDSAEAARALVDAASAALARFEPEAAAGMLDRAVAMADSAAARLLRARARTILGRYAEAGVDATAARGLGAGAEADEVEAWTAHFQRRFDRAVAKADEAARLSVDPAFRAVCLGLAGWTSLSRGDLEGAARRLTLAVTEAPGPGLPTVWLGWLRLNQGRPEDAVALARSAAGSETASYPFPNAYAGMSAAMGLAMLGRADDALRTLDTLDADIERMGARRWGPRTLNVRAWVLRNLGCAEEADELNAAAIEASPGGANLEAHTHAVLDLAARDLEGGDPDRATAGLEEGEGLAAGEFSFSWRLRLRCRLLRAQLALTAEDYRQAAGLAAELVTDTGALGLARYGVQARLVQAIAAARSDEIPDRDGVAAALASLERLAGLEAWRLTAAVAAASGEDAWRRLAGAQAATLIAHAGPYADRLRATVNARLG